VILRSPGSGIFPRGRSKTTSAGSWRSSGPAWRRAIRVLPGFPATWASGPATLSTIVQDSGQRGPDRTHDALGAKQQPQNMALGKSTGRTPWHLTACQILGSPAQASRHPCHRVSPSVMPRTCRGRPQTDRQPGAGTWVRGLRQGDGTIILGGPARLLVLPARPRFGAD
jgi:hypothetical protein